MPAYFSLQLLQQLSSPTVGAASSTYFANPNPNLNLQPLSVPQKLTTKNHPKIIIKQSYRSRSLYCSSSFVGASSVTVPMETQDSAADSKMDGVQRRLMFEDECILVDEQDRVIGHESKYNCHLMQKIESENLLHRAFSVFLFNSKYQLLLQQRSATKVTFPLVWTNTCCSHPLYRDSELIEENYLGVRNAAQRKLLDELVDYLLFIVRDVNVNPNPDEVADIKYVDREQLKELLRKADAGEGGITLSPWFRLVVDNFLLKWWDHVEKGTLQEAADMKTIHKLT